MTDDKDRALGQVAYEALMRGAARLGLLDDGDDAGKDEPVAWEELEPDEQEMFNDVARAAIEATPPLEGT